MGRFIKKAKGFVSANKGAIAGVALGAVGLGAAGVVASKLLSNRNADAAKASGGGGGSLAGGTVVERGRGFLRVQKPNGSVVRVNTRRRSGRRRRGGISTRRLRNIIRDELRDARRD